jgi:hypothetical protein
MCSEQRTQNMGGYISRESWSSKEERRQQTVSNAKQRLAESVPTDTRLVAATSSVERARRAMLLTMHAQLDRSGRPFIKADFMGILLFFAVLKGQDPLRVIRSVQTVTNEDLRMMIRDQIFASEETIGAMQQLGVPLPMATPVTMLKQLTLS